MGTVKTHLQSLPSPLKEMALKNADRSTLRLKEETLSQALSNAFCWDLSPQGHKFWHKVKDKIVEIENAMIVSGKYYNNLVIPNAHGVLVHLRINPTAHVPTLFNFVNVVHKDMEELIEMGTKQTIKDQHFSNIEDEDSVDYLQNHLSQFEEASCEL